jgi:cytidylate kinase
MQAQSEGIARMCAVTISREYGSGGGEIARRLAKHLGWQLVDHEIVVHTARELRISEAEAEDWDETSPSVVGQLLSSMRMLYPAVFSMPLDMPLDTDPQSYHNALEHVVQAAVKTGHMVIVGRGSQVLLADRHDVLHVRIVSSFEKRVKYVMQREGLTLSEAQARIRMKDSDRARYLQSEHHQHAEDAHLYDLVVNTSVLDLDSVVTLIQLALQQKSARLDLSEEALGPGAGMVRYTGLPHDLRPPVVDEKTVQ